MAVKWALQADRTTTWIGVAEGLGVAWNTAKDAVLTGWQLGPCQRSEPVRRRAGSWCGWTLGGTPGRVARTTVVVDLTAICDAIGPRKPGKVEVRSKRAFTIWLSKRPQGWRDEVVNRLTVFVVDVT